MRPAAWLSSFVACVGTLASAVVPAVAGAVLLSACGSCQSIVRQAAMPVLATATFDGVAADPSGQRLYFADQSNRTVDVVDTSGPSPRLAGSVDVPAPPNGLAAAPNLYRLYVGMDGGKVGVIDVDDASQRFLRVMDTITVDTTPNAAADLLDFSPQTKMLFVGTASGYVIAVDATTDKVTDRFDVMSPVEQPRFDPADGKLYVTTPGSDSLLQLDPSSGKITRTFKQKGCHPSGLAINPSRQLALVACRGSMALFNLRSGLDEVTRSVPGGDIVTYDAALDRFTVGSSHGPRDSSVGVFDGDGRFVGMVPSSPQAHGAVFDDATGLLYAVSATGLLSFSPAACAPPPDWLTFVGGASFYFLPLASFGVFLFWYARRRSRVDTSGSNQLTWEQLQQEDLAAERERMRDLEDAIYGPEGG
jgi:DNA-binding beta-propeller fold protein YncE